MAEVLTVAMVTRDRMREVAKQAQEVAQGLSKLALKDAAQKPSQSVQYLFDIADHASAYAADCEDLIKKLQK